MRRPFQERRSLSEEGRITVLILSGMFVVIILLIAGYIAMRLSGVDVPNEYLMLVPGCVGIVGGFLGAQRLMKQTTGVSGSHVDTVNVAAEADPLNTQKEE